MAQISIIVPVYKVKEYLDQCVQSVLAQTFTDFELLLVDDGSPDECGALCDAYAAADARVRAIHKPNGGLRSALLAGLENAQGEYIGYVDSDDWVDKDMFASLLTAARTYKADLVECGYVRTGGGTQEVYCSAVEHVLQKEHLQQVMKKFFDIDGTLLYFTGWPRWNKLWKTQLLHVAMQGCDTFLQIGEDCSQLCAYLPLCSCAVILQDNSHYFYRRSSVSMTMDYAAFTPQRYDKYLADCRVAVQKYGYSGSGFVAQKDRLLVMDLLGILAGTLPLCEKQQKVRSTLQTIENKAALLHPQAKQGLLSNACLFAFYLGLRRPVVALAHAVRRKKNCGQ